tara:strand:+ start:171 stop:335 length:165 start_codon:yes stop_codon:yes gene_type:complete
VEAVEAAAVDKKIKTQIEELAAAVVVEVKVFLAALVEVVELVLKVMVVMEVLEI